MNRVKTRTLTALVLAAAMAAGLLYYVVCFFLHGSEWASFQANRHVYTDGLVLSGRILDRYGEILSFAEDGQRHYHSDAELRKATLHAVGDRSGNIGTSVLTRYAAELIGYDPISGVRSLSDRGGTVRLSLDAELNRTALQALDGRSGTVVVYDYHTGEIYCMVSSPTFDPDAPPNLAEDETGYEGAYLNRAVSATFTPGSIFKLVTAAAAIEQIPGIFDMRFTCEGQMTVDGKLVTCHSVHGEVSLGNALAKSCNCAFGEIALLLGGEILAEYAAEYGLTEGFSMDVIKTADGRVDVHPDGSSELAWAGIGQSTNLVNPLSFLRFLGAIANGGEAVAPRWVLSASGVAGIPRTITAESSTQLISPKTANALSTLMAYNVESNYGRENYPGLQLCAKSGTAEVGADAQPHAWFAGFIQNEKAPLAFIVLVENGGSGSQTAGKVANTVLQAAVSTLGA